MQNTTTTTNNNKINKPTEIENVSLNITWNFITDEENLMKLYNL